MDKKVIVTDKLTEDTVKMLKKQFTVDVKLGLTPEQLKEIIGEYNAIVIRSGTKLTSDIIEKADKMEIIGRAGIGVDNVDLDTATKKGIVVVNAPASNSVTVAEHTIGLLIAIARNIPPANASLKSGKWEKSKFKGIEIEGKTLGIVGFGQIGSLVAKKARGLGMKVIAFDPFVSEERFNQLGIKKANKLEDLYKVSNFITIHLPKNKNTIGMFNKEEFYKMKKGTIILNVARGGIILEKDLAEAIKEGQIGGAAIDVYESEPCTNSPIFDLDEVICTPHLGASTKEAQNRAGTIIADQVISFLKGGSPAFPVNAPSVREEVMEAISPYFELCDYMGSLFAGLFEGNLESVKIIFSGNVADYDVSLLKSRILVKILQKYSRDVNIVNVNLIARENGLEIEEVKSGKSSNYLNLITLEGKGKDNDLTISGTITGKNNKPRFIGIDEFELDMVPSEYMAFIRYEDIPGQIGKIGTAFGKLNVNIAAMHVGRKKMSGDAVMGLNLDAEVTPEMLAEFKKISGFKNIKIVNL